MKKAGDNSGTIWGKPREKEQVGPDNSWGESIEGSPRYLLNCIGTIIVKMLFSHVIIILSES